MHILDYQFDHIPLGDHKEVLLKYISPDQLPEAYGGTRCEPDPYCTKYVSSALSWRKDLWIQYIFLVYVHIYM